MSEELRRLLEAEQEAIRKAEEALHNLDGPQPTPGALGETAEQALAERIAAHEAVNKHRAEHGCGS